MPTLQEVCAYNQKNVDWSKFFSVVKTIGITMNGKKDRFDKSNILELSLSIFSDNAIDYVNGDGVDHNLVNLLNEYGNPTQQEMKFSSRAFYDLVTIQRKTKNQSKVEGLKKLNKPVSLKLFNSNGTNGYQDLPSTYADFLLAVDNYSAWVIETKSMKPYLKFSGDGIEAKNVPSNLFLEVVGPDTADLDIKQLLDFDYKLEKIKFQREFLSRF